MVCRQKREDLHNARELVMANQAEFPTRNPCETLKVSASGYHDWQDRLLCKYGEANATLTVRNR
jgi:hypothetical protein